MSTLSFTVPGIPVAHWTYAWRQREAVDGGREVYDSWDLEIVSPGECVNTSRNWRDFVVTRRA